MSPARGTKRTGQSELNNTSKRRKATPPIDNPTEPDAKDVAPALPPVLPTIPDQLITSNDEPSPIQLASITDAISRAYEYLADKRDSGDGQYVRDFQVKLSQLEIVGAPVRRVPSETWQQIFEYVLRDTPDEDSMSRTHPAFQLSQVSRRWRKTMINTPHFWSTIRCEARRCYSFETMCLLKTILQRSADAPLNLKLRGTDEGKIKPKSGYTNALQLELMFEAERWEEFSYNGTWDTFMPFLKLSTLSLPRLRKASIIFNSCPLNGFPPAWHALLSNAPQVHDMTLRHENRWGGDEQLPEEWHWEHVKKLDIMLGGLGSLEVLKRGRALEEVKMCIHGLLHPRLYPAVAGLQRLVVTPTTEQLKIGTAPRTLKRLTLTSIAPKATVVESRAPSLASYALIQVLERMRWPGLEHIVIAYHNPFREDPNMNPNESVVALTWDEVSHRTMPVLKSIELDWGGNEFQPTHAEMTAGVLCSLPHSVKSIRLVVPFLHMPMLLQVVEAMTDVKVLKGLEELAIVYTSSRAWEVAEMAAPFGAHRVWSDEAHAAMAEFIKLRIGTGEDKNLRKRLCLSLPESLLFVVKSRVMRGRRDALTDSVAPFMDGWKRTGLEVSMNSLKR